MLLTGVEQDWVGTCCLLETALPPPTAALPPLAREFAPVSAAGRKPCRARRHKAQHANWRHSDVENSATPCIIICLLELQTIMFARTPSEVSEFQNISAGARDPVKLPLAGAAHPSTQWRHPSNRLPDQEAATGGSSHPLSYLLPL